HPPAARAPSAGGITTPASLRSHTAGSHRSRRECRARRGSVPPRGRGTRHSSAPGSRGRGRSGGRRSSSRSRAPPPRHAKIHELLLAERPLNDHTREYALALLLLVIYQHRPRPDPQDRERDVKRRGGSEPGALKVGESHHLL